MTSDRIPLVLLPGLLCDDALWRDQVSGLADVSSSRVADLTRYDTVADLAASVLGQAPERFCLAGLSMGGYVAFEILRQAPDRVDRLALLDTTARPDTSEQSSRRRGLMGMAEKGRFKGVTEQLLPQLIHESRLGDPALTGVVRAMAERVGKDAFLRQQQAIMSRPDSQPLLPRIDVPTLVLCGRQDALTPPDRHAEMAEATPDAEFVVLEDCGHLAPLERPEAVTEAMRTWLTRGPRM